jgi:hypothetical protein
MFCVLVALQSMTASTVVGSCSLFILYNVHSSFVELEQQPHNTTVQLHHKKMALALYLKALLLLLLHIIMLVLQVVASDGFMSIPV